MELAAQIYSGIIFPDAFSKSHPHLSELQRAMLDATPDCIKVLSVDGRLLTMNRAGCMALNIPENSEFGMPWLPLLPASVHELGSTALIQATEGQSARFPGQSESPDGLRYWDNLLTPIVDAGSVQSILCVSRDVTENKTLEKNLEAAVSREKLLSREMQHRIKNLFAVVHGLISLSEREAQGEDDPHSATTILRQKVEALNRASDAVFPDDQHDETIIPLTVDFRSLVHSVLRPYGSRCQLNGDRVPIGRSLMTTLALFLHEMATNSVKYGALGSEQGNVVVDWRTGPDGMRLTWVERDGPLVAETPARQGFGSEMVDRIIKSLGGTMIRTWSAPGLEAELHLPNSVLS